jgi:hypothetical protein
MNARLERKLRLLAVIAVASAVGGIAFVSAKGLTSPSAIATGIVIVSFSVLRSQAFRCSSWRARCAFGSAAFRLRPT